MIEETSTPLEGGPSACPFVAFEEDRDHRSSAPDYRHRCFAAAEPEPRAFPHQERYCLSSDFPRCPIFLDWARQEAAGVSQAGAASATGTTVGPGESGLAAAGALGVEEAGPAFLAGRSRPGPAAAAAPSTARTTDASASLWSYEAETKHTSSPPAPTAPSSLGAPSVAMARRGPTHPGWENPPRLENFPRLRSRDERRANQPLLVAALAVSILMVALVVIPIILSHGGTTGGGASPSASGGPSQNPSAPSASASQSASDTLAPGSSYLQYKVKPNDNLYVIATRFNLKLWEIELANPQLLDPNHLEVGQVLNIPPAGLLTQPPASPGAS